MNKKYLVIILFVLALGLGFFFNIQDNKVSIALDSEVISVDAISIPNLDIKKQNIDNINTIIEQEDFSKASENSRLVTFGVCNKSINELNDAFYQFEGLKELTEEQLLVKSRLIKGCENWYEYTNTLSKKDADHLIEERKNTIEQNKYFYKNIEIPDDSKINEARSIMATGGDSSNLTGGALSYLMTSDSDFISEVAKRQGTTDLNLIRQSSTAVMGLYSCKVDPYSCSANSLQMMSLCISNEVMCGLSYNQYYASTVTPNHYADMMNIIRIIEAMIQQGYFN